MKREIKTPISILRAARGLGERPLPPAIASVCQSISTAWASKRGTAAIEFALIAPTLAAMVLGVSQVTDILVGSSRMQTAVRASIQYVLNGGSDLATAESVGMQAWSSAPANATLVASEYCTCSGATAVCTQTCTDGSVPYQYVSVTAAGYLGGSIYNLNKTETQTARIR